MKVCSKCRIPKNENDFHKNKALKGGLANQCKSCAKITKKTNYEKDKDLILSRQRKKYSENPEKYRAVDLKWRTENPEAAKASCAKWASSNPETKKQANRNWKGRNTSRVSFKAKNWAARNSDKIKEKTRRWARANVGTVLALNAERRASRIMRTPKWLTEKDLQDMKEFYRRASSLSKETGVNYHVDHILPLRGELVSGLHVPGNLQILTASENSRKGNYWSP